MAKHTITHSCGHDETIILTGKPSQRAFRQQQEESRPCVDCVRAAATKAATDKATDLGWPALVGTPKQIAWAETLRSCFHRDALRWGDSHATADELAQVEAAVLNKIATETSASAWIDERHVAASHFAFTVVFGKGAA